MTTRIIELKDKDWAYPFELEACRAIGLSGSHNFDPFPAYPADANLVRELLNKVSAIWPLKQDLTLFISNKELVDRVNAFATYSWDYKRRDEDGNYPWNGVIVISGKRIPIHPAMVRHLVAHEYGHQVMYEMCSNRSDKNMPYEDKDTLMKEYCKVRGMKHSKRYGGGHWHDSPGEVFANDFRTIICGEEAEYWPHPQLKHPLASPDVIDWWNAQRQQKMRNS